jgi:hypothetical protein
MRREYRDGRGGDARDPRGIADRPRAPARTLFDDLAGETGDGPVVEPVGDQTAGQGLPALQTLPLAHDVALVANTVLEHAPLVRGERPEDLGEELREPV